MKKMLLPALMLLLIACSLSHAATPLATQEGQAVEDSTPGEVAVPHEERLLSMHRSEVEMTIGKKFHPVVIWLGVALLQLIMTQVVTFLFSFLFPEVENFQRTHPVLFAALLGFTFSLGVFLPGWLALRFRWLKAKPLYPARLAGTMIGAALPLLIALIIYRILEAGNPFFLISILASILGFHLPGWVWRQHPDGVQGD
jgi:hypothetical protein